MNAHTMLPNKVQSTGGDGGRTPLRVALVSSSSGSRGGGEFYLTGLAAGLTAIGHEVHSVLSDHSRMDELASQLANHGKVHRVQFQNTYDRRTRCLGAVLARREIRRVADVLVGLCPDVVHINKQNLEDGLDLLLAATQTELPTVSTIHVTRSMSNLGSVLGGARDWLSARVLRSASCPFIAIANSGVADLAALNIDPQRLHLVWNGVSPHSPSDREAMRRSWGCGPEHVALGCVARIEPQKNPLFMPQLMARLPQNVRLVWIGDGSLADAMRQSALAAGVADRVVLPGWQHNARSFMSGFDVFVLPSLYEGFPFAILEAMAAGLPCVVSEVDGIGEAVVDGQTGFICPPNATETWLERIQRYSKDPAARAIAGDLAKARYAEQFSLEAMAQKTARVYEHVLNSTQMRARH